jgi:hypothetical protein
VALAIVFAALIAGLCWYAWQHYNAGFGVLRVNSLAPLTGYSDSAAISADGTQVAILHQDLPYTAGPLAVDVRNVQSGQQVAKLTIPQAIAGLNKEGYLSSRRLSFCDGGEYLVAFAVPDRMYVADTHPFKLRDPISLFALRVTAAGDPGHHTTVDTPVPEGNVEFDCAASSGVAVLGFSADLGVVAIKLIDLDSGKEIADLGGTLKGRYESYQGDGLAISPDGSKVAMVVWLFGDDGGPTVNLVDARSQQVVKSLHLGDGFKIDHKLAFAGEGTLIIGEPECQRNGKCDARSLPSNRKLRLWDFGGSGAVRMMGAPGSETYRSFGASADGDVVFAYTGDESYCGFCNSRNGELKIHNARFTVWNRASGEVAARSPSLRVETHSCPWLMIMGSCESYQQVPEMEMSANGKAILAIWQAQTFPPPVKITGLGEPEVYTLR